jgi:penicillin-binding protein 1A
MRSNYWGEGGHNALFVVSDFFQQTLAARLIDSRAEFPFARPSESIWDPLIDAAKEWLGGLLRDWLWKEKSNAPERPGW